MWRLSWLGWLGLVVLWKPPTCLAQTPERFVQGVKKMRAQHRAGKYKDVIALAQKLVSPRMNQYEARVVARYYLVLGMSLIRTKRNSLGESAYRRAVELQPGINVRGTEPPLSQALMTKVKRQYQRKQKFRPGFLKTSKSSGSTRAPSPGGGAGPPLGTVIGLSLAVVAVASLSVGITAGVNALVDIGDLGRIRDSAQALGLAQVHVAPALQELQSQAETQGLVANIFYSVAGAAAIASVLVLVFVKPPSPSTKQASRPLRRSSFARSRLERKVQPTTSRLFTLQ